MPPNKEINKSNCQLRTWAFSLFIIKRIGATLTAKAIGYRSSVFCLLSPVFSFQFSVPVLRSPAIFDSFEMPFEMNMQKSRATARINKYKIRGERTQKTKTGSILELRPRQLDKPSSQRDSGCFFETNCKSLVTPIFMFLFF